MTGPTTPGSPPPEVPEEFAAAYRAAYEQALAAQVDGAQPSAPAEEPVTDTPAGDDEPDLPVRQGPLRVGTHRVEKAYDDAPTWFERARDSRWFVPLLLALLAAALILGAYAVASRFAGKVAVDAAPGAEPSMVTGGGGTKLGEHPVTEQTPGDGAWDGDVKRIRGVSAAASCTSASEVDARGRTVAYDAGNLTDGVVDTAWRCDGSAVGERITLDLGRKEPIGQVGLIPGYARTDEQSEADSFAENHRITRVSWIIGDRELVQKFSGSPDDRSLQVVRVPRTTADTIELMILAVTKGQRNATAISEIQVSRAGR